MVVLNSVDEFCIPMKVFMGHLIALNKDNEIDRVFYPLMRKIHDGDSFCPKFLGLPDIVKAIATDLDNKFITAQLYGDNEEDAHINLFKELSVIL